MELAQWVCVATGWLLAGLGLVVAVVVYPAFEVVGEAEWPSYHDQHSRRITMVVAPAWLLEGIATAWWLLGSRSWLSLLHAVAAAGTVAFTLLGAIPRHNEIARGRSPEALRGLAVANGWRTACWIVAALVATAATA